MNKEKIEKFWNWFTDNERQITDAVQNETASEFIIENLDNLILDLGMFKWEIGRGKIRPYFLTISPNGDEDLMFISREVMENAPQLDQWEFNFFEPAKDWDLTFNVFDNNMDEQHIDASNWNYVALDDNAGRIKLIIEAENIGHLDIDTASIAANMVVTGEVGEEVVIQKISSVEIVEYLDKEHELNKLNIQELKFSI